MDFNDKFPNCFASSNCEIIKSLWALAKAIRDSSKRLLDWITSSVVRVFPESYSRVIPSLANEGITLEYDSGNTRTTLEVIQSRSLLLESRIAFAKAQRDFMISQFELAKQLGNLSLKSIK